ncbi:rod shape-determining protein MreD [Taylorella equigenitalis]|uniref:rod shape-determining protein MreD n=1 Tax=Taylorella equigenitalis TaxID=29575 RepID=UPI001CEF5B11|nr:rod shape-determining protein MreD [Taylorella equigenitalis]
MMNSPKNKIHPIGDNLDTFRPSFLFVWGSLFFAWLFSLLPWRTWEGSPDLLILVIAYWFAHNVPGMDFVVAIIVGLLMDVFDTTLLGSHSLNYILVLAGIALMRQRTMQYSVLVQFIVVLPIFIFASLPSHLFESWLHGYWGGWSWLISGLITSALWIVVDIIFKFFGTVHYEQG